MNEQSEIRLLISSGEGPAECRRAVSHVVRQMVREAKRAGFSCDVWTPETVGKQDPASAVVTLAGNTCEAVGDRWVGTIQWTCKSPFRPNHKRQNWFAGVFVLPTVAESNLTLNNTDLKFESFRAGGAGGQHQNTTDSAVRVTHIPTGIVALSRDERSQHRNKQTALRRLADQFFMIEARAIAVSNSEMASLHKQIERGNPVRRFNGSSFKEMRL